MSQPPPRSRLVNFFFDNTVVNKVTNERFTTTNYCKTLVESIAYNRLTYGERLWKIIPISKR